MKGNLRTVEASELRSTIESSDTVIRLVDEFLRAEHRSLHIISKPFIAFLLAKLIPSLNRSILFVGQDTDWLDQLESDFILIADKKPINLLDENQLNIAGTYHFLSGDINFYTADYTIFFTNFPTVQSLRSSILSITTGETVDYQGLISSLKKYNFQRKDYVEEVGDFALRGSIIDVFPESTEYPVRIDFFGDTVESIRIFNPITQRSIKPVKSVMILPFRKTDSRSSSLLDAIPPGTLIILQEPGLFKDIYKDEGDKILHTLSENINSFFINLIRRTPADLTINATPQPGFNGRIEPVAKKIHELCTSGYRVFITSSTHHLQQNLANIISEYDDMYSTSVLTEIYFVHLPLSAGLVLPDDRIAILSEHEIFGRRSVSLSRREKAKKFVGLLRRDLHTLRKGDYLVHEDYGIGKFIGLEKIKIVNSIQECAKVEYADGDVLYVNINYLAKLQKYSSEDGFQPKLNKLGGGDWEALKRKAKGKLKDIAKDLIRLYAQRKKTKGIKFAGDTIWQHELELSFTYEDTPDQIRSTLEIKNDMESETPMNRLLCGDVGFGKTEIAIRAAFKATMSGKQVVVLVPTTILAEQHYNTFKDRLSQYAVAVDVISRFRKKTEQNRILKALEAGTIDIIIGTHRLLSNDVKFHDLGLLIVDEEHRFGVQAKEKIRQLCANVDTLYMTATPIPRTLYMSLSSAMDISILQTPPANRLPIETYVINFDPKTIQSAIEKELDRGGQVFVVSDSIRDLSRLADLIRRRVPTARIGILHAKMPSVDIEKTMIAFLKNHLNVLVATKIIEAGIDIPSVNTLIINNADHFGLAELYQLRGRIGRSNIQAYAYLIAKPFSNLSRDAARRLMAIEEFSQLGSGFNLAMRDLEIRGAGNLLGREQSGFINNMGFEMYNKILEEAVEEARFEEHITDQLNTITRRKIEPQLIVDVDAFIPDDYVSSDTERFDIYKRLSRATSLVEIDELSDEIADRFGKLPPPTANLLTIIKIKINLEALRIPRLEMKGSKISLSLPSNDENFYRSNFPHLMNSLDKMNDLTYRIVQERSEARIEIDFHTSTKYDSAVKLERITRLVEELKNNT